MSCCGKLRTRTLPQQNATAGDGRQRPAPTVPLVQFEYGGATGLTAVGPVTGRRYRFERPRARVAVDSRDAAAMAAVPGLRQVKGT